jgi:TPR repeat protein
MLLNKRENMFTKKFIIASVLAFFVILTVLFWGSIKDKFSSVEQISNLTESKSLSYYKKSCEYQDSDVCNQIGDIYHYGRGDVSVDYDDAVTYYTRSCELENGKGCNNLAYMLNQGYGLEKNNWNALKLYKKACKYGEMEACYNVGSMYFHGEGSKRNYYSAALFFQKSCNNGIGAGCNDLGYMYEHGKYVRHDRREAMSLYADACDMGEASGCNNLAHMHEKSKRMQTAKQYYSRACDLGDAPSCNRLESVLGKKIREIKGEVALNEAINACRVATRGGTMCYRVGLYYEREEDNEKARQYFEAACNRGQSQSCKHLGDLYR